MVSEPEFFLYHSPGSRSGRTKMMLDRLELEYGLHTIDMARDEQKSEAYRRIHPFGLLPSLWYRGQVILESGAQVMFLADRYPQFGLCPPANSPLRARYIELFLLSSALIEPVARAAWQSPNDAEKQAAFRTGLRVLDDRVAGPFLLGKHLSAADIFVHWGMRFLEPERFDGFARLSAYVEKTNQVLDWTEY